LLRLCLILTVALTVYSCRTDQFPEAQPFNDSSKFQLTSKRISLDEAKHKAQLLPEIEKIEAEFKVKTKTNAFGKTINYGNGVSIDTDEVMYIEKGPNIHTYTFHINRENNPADAPLENLVLSNLPDGTYRELLVSYNFTLQEKQMLENGIPVDAKGKVTITELAQGTYNNGGLMERTGETCVFIEKTMWHPCSSGDHNGFNANECNFISNPSAGTPPTSYVMITRQCTAQPVDYGLGDNGEGGGGSSGGLGGGNEEPEIPTIPTIPGGPKSISPCAILKRNSNDTPFQKKLDSLKTRVMPSANGYDEHETVVVVTNDHGQLVYNTYITPSEAGSNVQYLKIGVTDSDIAVMHNHTIKSAFLAPSYIDLVEFYNHYKFLDAGVQPYYIHYLACYNGEVYALKADNVADLDAFFADFLSIGSGNFSKDEQAKAYNKMKRIYKINGMKDEILHDKEKSEKIFLNIAKSFGNGISLYRRDGTTWGKLRLDPDGTVKSDDCPL